jgi:hypothetical protein
LSKIKNVAKLTSEISSSPRVISWVAGATVAAGALLTSDNDNPAALNKGPAHARCIRSCFVCDMVESSLTMLNPYEHLRTPPLPRDLMDASARAYQLLRSPICFCMGPSTVLVQVVDGEMQAYIATRVCARGRHHEISVTRNMTPYFTERSPGRFHGQGLLPLASEELAMAQGKTITTV